VRKIYFYIGLLSFTVVVFIACNKARGPVEEQEIVIDPITGIDLSIRDNVYISQGASQRIIIEGQDNVIEELNKEVKNGIWKIYFAQKPSLYKNMKIHITVPDINYISLSGPGMVISKTMMELDTLSLVVTGSGNIDVDAYVNKLHCSMLGKGDIFLKGTCEKQYINNTGTGRINSFDMLAQQCVIGIEGDGTSDVAVDKKLNVRITGNGSVNYYGNPEVQSEIDGTGVVTKIR